MPRVTVRSSLQSEAVPLPLGYAGTAGATAIVAGQTQPLHLHNLALAARARLTIQATTADRLFYVWRGKVEAGGHQLDAGSSFIVEHGAGLDLAGLARQSLLLAFSPAQPDNTLLGGNVHILPADRVPRVARMTASSETGGAMHADGDCPTCSIWLHENSFPPSEASRSDAEAGIHSHSEDEIIFVTEGEIRLGQRLFGPGTALAIAAETLYSFTPGPKGLKFINYRTAKPGDIRFRSGHAMNEPKLWRDLLPHPDYLSPINRR